MNFVGIIAEYNPFHRGHAWQLEQLRLRGAKRIAVVMSSGLTQRGDLPLLPEPVRVNAALRNGADLVFALPAPYACSGAESFARAGVALLTALGCDTLAFGAESPDTEALLRAAEILNGADYRSLLGEVLAHGARNFASARQTALTQLFPFAEQFTASPNNNLGLEYCKAVLEQRSPLSPLALPRVGADHGEGAPNHPLFASATALRTLWLANGATALAPYLPSDLLPLYREAEQNGMATDPQKTDTAVLALLHRRIQTAHYRGKPPADAFRSIRGVSEGLEYRLAQAVPSALSLDALCDSLTGVRYPRARVRRLCMDAALGYGSSYGSVGSSPADNSVPVPSVSPDVLPLPVLPPYLHLLGAKKDALSLVKRASLPVSHSLVKLSEQSENCRRVAVAHAAAVDLSALCRSSPLPMGTAYTQKTVFL